jgi:hypothetical protein
MVACIFKIWSKIVVFTSGMTLCLSISFQTQSQSFKVDTILYNGPVAKCINLAFLSEGYKDNELADYVKSVETSANNYLSVSPFKQYRSYFNVFAIRVPSKESGADHPRTAPDCPPESEHPKLTVDTYFNSTFDSNNIHRLLVTGNYSAVNNVILNNFPLFDQKVMLVNTSYYGGSGGSVAVASLHSAVNELVLHESGHTFAALGDEYWAGDGYAAEKVNMTKETNPELVKWKNWLGVEGVGIYQHGTSGNQALWFRPSQNCKMRALGSEFCPVCKEAITLSILRKFGTPVKFMFPEQQNLTNSGETVQFKVTLYKPFPNTLRTKWVLNGTRIAMNSDSLSLNPGLMVPGMNTLSMEVLDTTALIRYESHARLNTDTIVWNIQKITSETANIPGLPLFEVFPNPFDSEIHIESGEWNQKTEFEILNTLGQVVMTGSFYGRKIVDSGDFKPGIYIVKCGNGSIAQFKKIVKY